VAKVLGLDIRNVRDRRRVNRAIRQWVEEGVLKVRHISDERRIVREYVGGDYGAAIRFGLLQS
jgi:hypothetical protein